MVRIATTALGLALVFVGAPASLEAQSLRAGGAVTIPNGQVREGDLYAAVEALQVIGRLTGDLVVAANRVVVEGQVDGDLFAAAGTVDLRGPIGDSTRVVGQMLTVDTTVDGDLLAGVNELVVTENARIAGGLVAAGSRVEIEGTVEDDIRVAAGVIVIRGTVHGDAYLIADRLDLAPGARITGDLEYQARTPPEPRGSGPGGGRRTLRGAAGRRERRRWNRVGRCVLVLADAGGAAHRHPHGRAVPARRAAAGRVHCRGGYPQRAAPDSPPSC